MIKSSWNQIWQISKCKIRANAITLNAKILNINITELEKVDQTTSKTINQTLTIERWECRSNVYQSYVKNNSILLFFFFYVFVFYILLKGFLVLYIYLYLYLLSYISISIYIYLYILSILYPYLSMYIYIYVNLRYIYIERESI